MPKKQQSHSPSIGIWLVGAFGGVGSTVALGLAALKRQLTDTTGLVTESSLFSEHPMDPWESFVLGGHDIRNSSFAETVKEFQDRSNIFHPAMVEPCQEELAKWSSEVKPGCTYRCGETIEQLASPKRIITEKSPGAAIERITKDLLAFQTKHKLKQVVVVNVASTEPPQDVAALPASAKELNKQLQKGSAVPLPASALYALAAIEAGFAYVNFTPSLGANFPAAIELANAKGVPISGQDGKTGETLLKSVLAPMFVSRNLKMLSWVGHNIFGNRDGVVLNDPRNKESKIRTKDKLISSIAGYKPQTHVSIEYIESLDDWKTAWDHIHFQGFLGVKMIMQFIWQGCDSILAAPLVLDLARLTLLAQRNKESGVLQYLAPFFKSPMGVEDHDFFRQMHLLTSHFSK